MKARNTAKEVLSGLTSQHSTETYITTILKAKEFTNGQTGASSTDPGKRTKCMVREYSHGTTNENMLVSTGETKNKDSEYLLGQMVVSTRASGSKENKKASVFTQIVKVKQIKGCGRTERELIGYLMKNTKKESRNVLHYTNRLSALAVIRNNDVIIKYGNFIYFTKKFALFFIQMQIFSF